MVQRLTSTVNGKCQKYNRMGPLTLEPTLDSIKEACKAHFNTDLDCDVLAGERGPSYTDGSQIKNFKVIHVRSLNRMLKLGKVIVPEANVVTINLKEFSIANMQWLEPFEVTLSLQRKPF